MKILAAGGGSGGHVTPVVAVLQEVKKHAPRAEVRFWCDHKFASQARGLMANFDPDIKVDTIVSGKLRRYHHLSTLQQLSQFSTIVLPNLRDGFLVGLGLLQSLIKLLLWRPDVVFTKGGYVCLPIGLAARILGIPLVIHDSDAHPGLTNRILSRWATQIATGAPLKFYPYPESISHYVGVPVGKAFHSISREKQNQLKQQLGFDDNRPLIVVTGGGLGARRINEAVAENLDALLKITNVILVSGAGQYDDMRALTPGDDVRFQLHAFVKGMEDMLGAADLVVARAGATTILELAALEKPTILVPNGFLTGGHQLKNAAVYAEGGAVSVIDENDLEAQPKLLYRKVKEILDDEAKMRQMSKAFGEFAKPDAAARMAELVLGAIRH